MRRDLAHLIAIESLVTVAATLAGSFSIVFLINSGYGIFESSLFYLQGFGWAAALCLVVGARGFGSPRAAMAVGVLAQGCFYLSFVMLQGVWLFAIAPMFFGIYIVCFWVPYNILMLRQTSKRNRGEMIGLFFLVFPVIGLASPIIGGYLIEGVGYGLLFAMAFLALLANAALIAISPSTHTRPMRGALTLRGMGRRLGLGLFFEGGQEGVWWTMVPLISMLFISSESNLGYLFALFNLAGGVASVVVARLSDRNRARVTYVRAIALCSAPVLFAIALVPSLEGYLVLAGLAYLLVPILQILLFAMATDRMERRKASCSITRELLLNTGRLLGGGIVALTLLSTGDVRLAYAVSGVMVLGMALTR
jgi:MFS family permease